MMATYLVGKRSPELTSKRNALESVFMMASLLDPNLSTEKCSEIANTNNKLLATAYSTHGNALFCILSECERW